ncbi:uncharacterized protein LOC111315183 [Durio zibethinus]|uniref:Uncharacterized protein LOC111315183 n=1 Tax=Durio zibethinus TaxID=66656 RepID=A0A6P6B5Q6_DURZI|nr:uncharacterized protein LOC111315183 [Durio zibethinus]
MAFLLALCNRFCHLISLGNMMDLCMSQFTSSDRLVSAVFYSFYALNPSKWNGKPSGGLHELARALGLITLTAFSPEPYLSPDSFHKALVFASLEVPFFLQRLSSLSFVAGQPIGYHTSWPFVALSPGRLFRQYAILGDDVVIANEKVASVYEDSFSKLGVSFSYHKSLIFIFNTGCAEFAKRFRALSKLTHTRSRSLDRLYLIYNMDQATYPTRSLARAGSSIEPYLRGHPLILLRNSKF